MSQALMAHSSCKNHVSLGTGVCYCPQTQCIYSQPHCVLAKSFIEGETLARDLKIFVSQMAYCQKAYSEIKPVAYIMLGEEGVMNGMNNDGQTVVEFIKSLKGGWSV